MITVGDLRILQLVNYLTIFTTRDTLKGAWLSLTDEERASVRRHPRLARHARSVLSRSDGGVS